MIFSLIQDASYLQRAVDNLCVTKEKKLQTVLFQCGKCE